MPFRTVSRYPFQSLATTGIPLAIASMVVSPKLSWTLSLNDRKMSAASQASVVRSVSSAPTFIVGATVSFALPRYWLPIFWMSSAVWRFLHCPAITRWMGVPESSAACAALSTIGIGCALLFGSSRPM